MIQAFRSLRPDRIEYLLSVIRSTDSIEEIAIALGVNLAEFHLEDQTRAQAVQELREATADVEPPGESNPRKRRMVMSIQSLADEPLFDLPAKPWTNVTDDNHFVSHLVSLYFTWEHAACHIIERELFLADMKSGQLDSQCCSPLLVNALLATACVSMPIYVISCMKLMRGSAFQTILRLVPSRAGRKLEETSSLPKRSGCGRASRAQTASQAVEHCA